MGRRGKQEKKLLGRKIPDLPLFIFNLQGVLESGERRFFAVRVRQKNFLVCGDRDGDAEAILQEVFSELVEAYRLMQPIEQVGAWLYRVARNRITDFFRKRKPERFSDQPALIAGDEAFTLEDLLPSPDAGPEACYARSVLLEELVTALDELPAAQREVFIAHEIEGRSFKELAAETGLAVNTLLSRKHYAVMHLRARLRDIYDEWNTSMRRAK